MLRTIAFILFGLILSAPLPAQDYSSYHEKINRAEEFLGQEDFQAALALYQEVVDSFDFVFVKDVLVAAQIAAFLNRPQETTKWLQEGFSRGLRKDCVKDIKIFDSYVASSEWKYVLQDYQSVRKGYLGTIDFEASKEWAKRYEREQKTKGKEFYRDVVVRNFERIEEYTKRGEFPGDRQIGVDYSRLSKDLTDCDLGNSKVIVTLLHQPYAYSSLEEDLEAAVLSGDLHPREYAMIYVFEQTKQSVLYKNSLQEDVTIETLHFNLPFQATHKDLDRVNADRARFLLGTVETEAAKKALEEKYGFNLFFGYR